jgi:hypothetical protein
MTPAERKAVGYLIRQACDLFAAGEGNRPIWERRKIMREAIAQPVEEAMAGFAVEGVLAETLIAANAPADPEAGR